MLNRENCFTRPGGDTVQMLETKRHLEMLDVQVDVSLRTDFSADNYDIAHIFNIQKGAVAYSLEQIKQAKKMKLPVALSTIYWHWQAQQDRKYLDYRRKLKASNKSLVWCLRSFINEVSFFKIYTQEEIDQICRKYVYDNFYADRMRLCIYMSDVLLPNAVREITRLKKDLDIVGDTQLHTHIIPNGVDAEWAKDLPSPERFRVRYGIKDFVLCVGRVEPSKNQLALIRALRNEPLPLVLIGSSAGAYADFCREEARHSIADVLILDHMDHAELLEAYVAAKVHALPSWRETPGLAALEAAAAGCNIVVTQNGTASEYFGDLAWYCDPTDIGSIRNAVLDAYRSESQGLLREHILRNFTWEIAAERILDAYLCMLKRTTQVDYKCKMPLSLTI